jgi:hypothetical protein
VQINLTTGKAEFELLNDVWGNLIWVIWLHSWIATLTLAYRRRLILQRVCTR